MGRENAFGESRLYPATKFLLDPHKTGRCGMASKRMCFVVFVLAAFLVLTPGKMFAQMAGTGSIAGTVTDPSGAAVAGATATLTDISTSSVRTSVSNEAGRYFFANVLPGT